MNYETLKPLAIGTWNFKKMLRKANSQTHEIKRGDKMPYSVYILQCADESLYIGCTNNLEKRLKQHNDSKRGAHYTKIRRPTRLVFSEDFGTLTVARKREAEIKNWRREKKLDLIMVGKYIVVKRELEEGLASQTKK